MPPRVILDQFGRARVEDGEISPTPTKPITKTTPRGDAGKFLREQGFTFGPSDLSAFGRKEVTEPAAKSIADMTLKELQAMNAPARAALRAAEAAPVPVAEKPIAEIPTPRDVPEAFVPPEPTATGAAITFLTGITEDIVTKKAQIEADRKRRLEGIETQRKTEERRKVVFEAREKAALDESRLLTEPFREDLEEAERERLKVEENFFANQKSVSELETLMNQALAEVEAMKAKTGLDVIRNPRINKTINDFNARIGVVEAVMSARNGQINVANNLIDRTSIAINADRNDQLAYYDAVRGYYKTKKDDSGKQIVTLKADEEKILDKQISDVENDLAESKAVANAIKGLMLEDPSMVEGAGISLNDSLEGISKKMSDWNYQQERQDVRNEMVLNDFKYISTPAEVTRLKNTGRQVIAITDSRGVDNFYLAPPPKVKAISPTATAREMEGEMNTALGSVVGKDNFVSPDDYNELKTQWIQAGGVPTVFDTKFKGYRNPNNPGYGLTKED